MGFVETLSRALGALADPLHEPVLLAIPVFILFVTIEWVSARVLEAREPGGYHARDAVTSLVMGASSQLFWLLGKLLGLVLYAAVWVYLAPWHLPSDAWYTWVLAIVGTDFLYYWYHRSAHRIRLVWATHQAHHSSEYYNFATALRQKWNNSGEIIAWLPLPLLGVPPWMVFTGFSVSLVYQFFVHTERVGRLPAPIEFVFNTPSHHRVHHGSDADYLDRNYGGILILWDRMFGTFRPETHRPTYGLTTPVTSHNPFWLQLHEYVAIWRDIRGATSWRERLGYVFGPPGWRPGATPVAAPTPAPAAPPAPVSAGPTTPVPPAPRSSAGASEPH